MTPRGPIAGEQNARADLVSADWCEHSGDQTIEGVGDDSGLAFSYIAACLYWFWILWAMRQGLCFNFNVYVLSLLGEQPELSRVG